MPKSEPTHKRSEKPTSPSSNPALRSLSGAGFEFEDLVNAWLQVRMLGGEPAPAIGGLGTQIQAQVDALGWRIDDLLLSVMRADGATGRLAISAKGNTQVTSTGLPADFVSRAWQQWRATDTPVMRGADGLALVTQAVLAAFDPHWGEIKAACSGSDNALALSRIRGNARQLRIFNSVRSATATPADATDEEAIELIRHLHVLPVDFQLATSHLKNDLIGKCRRMLTSGDLVEAEAMWNHLVSVATEVRIRRGTLTLAELWSDLRKRFNLRDHPNYAHAWETLANLTSDHKARIETALPTGYSLARTETRAKLEAAIEANLVTVVLGDSGTGKSALAKTVLDEQFGAWTQVWFGPDALQTAVSAARRGTLPLRHELSLILKASRNARNVLVLDAAERIAPTEYSVVRNLLQALLAEVSGVDDALWRVIIITQSQNGAQSITSILQNRPREPVAVGLLDEAEVNEVLWATPTLGWLTGHSQTVAALTNPQTLGWVLSAGSQLASAASGFTSHTAVADHLWEYWTDGAPDFKSLMMRLAEREAAFERSFRLTSLAIADVAIFTRRPTALPLRLNTRTNHVEFVHDLAADWARFQFLKQIANKPSEWGALAENPLWANALRMLGQFLLRQPSGPQTAWDDAFSNPAIIALPLASDILLDALSLDPEAERFLTERVDFLLAGHAAVLARLLRRFMHIATVPTMSAMQSDPGLGLYFEAKFRTLIIGRWPPLLNSLSRSEVNWVMTNSQP